jgi:hypothetical protein
MDLLPDHKPQPSSCLNTPAPSSPTTLTSDFDPEGHFEPDPTPSIVSPPQISSKYNTLPPREPSSRVRNALIRYGVEATPDDVDAAINAKAVHAHVLIAYTGDPPSYQHVLSTPHSKEWEAVLKSEYNQLINTGTFEWVWHSPPGYKPISSKLVCHEKLDGEGDVYQRKIHIVARGFSQIPDIDFHVTHSAVAKYSTLRAMLAIAVHEDLELHQVDVVGAYLQGDLDKEIHMTPPAGLNSPGTKG